MNITLNFTLDHFTFKYFALLNIVFYGGCMFEIEHRLTKEVSRCGNCQLLFLFDLLIKYVHICTYEESAILSLNERKKFDYFLQ